MVNYVIMNIMKANNTEKDATRARSPRTVCFASCRKLNSQVSELKQSIVDEFQARMPGNTHLIEVAVNEAEALAWQTAHPHLFFPALAREKATAATRWAARQELIRHNSFTRALAA